MNFIFRRIRFVWYLVPFFLFFLGNLCSISELRSLICVDGSIGRREIKAGSRPYGQKGQRLHIQALSLNRRQAIYLVSTRFRSCLEDWPALSLFGKRAFACMEHFA